MEHCNAYLKTLAGYRFKTVEQNICGVRHFLRYLHSEHTIVRNYADKTHMLTISKSAKVPSTWDLDELRSMIANIDRNNPIGKQDYAMIILACVLGLRIGDIKNGRPSFQESDIVFLKHMPPFNPISDNNNMAHHIVHYMRKAGIERCSRKRSSFHSLRHSKAMHMLEASINIVYIRDFLGHEDISTTMIYLKMDNQLKNEAINKLSPKVTEETNLPDL